MRIALVTLTALGLAAVVLGAEDPKLCLRRFNQLEREFEDESDALVDYVNERARCSTRDCIRKDPKVRQEVGELIEKLKMIGAMNGCAHGLESKRDIRRSIRSHLREYIEGLEEMLAEIETERTLHLFQFILDRLKRAARWTW